MKPLRLPSINIFSRWIIIALVASSAGGAIFSCKEKILFKLGIANPPPPLNNEYLEGSKTDALWATKIMGGGYILHFRHAHRNKDPNVFMYDSLESDVHQNGKDKSRMSEYDYFSKSVCLNEQGVIQAKAMGEHLKNIKFPIGKVVSSVSCRARQTADLAFNGYSKLYRDLLHAGPYTEDLKTRTKRLKTIYLSIPVIGGANAIVSSHNAVLIPSIFSNSPKQSDLVLEEGGFVVISRNLDKGGASLKFEHKFKYFNDFIRHFYRR